MQENKDTAPVAADYAHIYYGGNETEKGFYLVVSCDSPEQAAAITNWHSTMERETFSSMRRARIAMDDAAAGDDFRQGSPYREEFETTYRAYEEKVGAFKYAVSDSPVRVIEGDDDVEYGFCETYSDFVEKFAAPVIMTHANVIMLGHSLRAQIMGSPVPVPTVEYV